MEEFLELWPVGVRNGAGEPVRGNRKDLEKKMIAFLNKYKYTKDTIMSATRMYLKRQSQDGYRFCNGAHYFVSKEGVSKLANECDVLGIVKPDTEWGETV